MTNRKNTKKALLSSVLALILCFTMLLGSTYAWFTDSASTAVNSIQSGTLDVDLVDVDGNSVVGQTLNFNYIDNEMWEPGASYELEDVYVVNEGNLALKYKIIITGVDGDAKLLEAIDWTCKVGGTTFDVKAGTQDHVLEANQTSSAIKIVGAMKTEAGNEYQGLTLDGIGITVLATQAAVESDSFTNTYDAGAEYGEAPVAVANPAELGAALVNGDNVILTDDITFSSEAVIDIPANADVTIDLAGYDLDVSNQKTRPFELGDGAALVIEAGDSEIIPAEYGLVKVPAGEATVVVNGGTYEFDGDWGAFVKVVSGASADITLNNVTYTDNGDGFIVNSNGGEANVTINGGTYTAPNGYGIQADNVTVNGATISTGGAAIHVSNGVAKVTDSVITTGNITTLDDGVPAAGISVGYGATAYVEGCTMNSALYDFAVLPGSDPYDGDIYVTGGTNGGAAKSVYYGDAVGKIVIDGQLK